MSKDKRNKKLLLGSALAGLMIAGPGLSVTAIPSSDTGSNFFQAAELTVEYRLAEAGTGPGDPATGDKGDEAKATAEKKAADEKAAEKKPEASPTPSPKAK